MAVPFDLTNAVPAHTRNLTLDQSAQLRAFTGFEEESGRTDELQRVPLDGIVTRRYRQTTRRVMMFYRELNRGCRRDTDGYDANSHRL
jgi:hypothetical protein